MIVKSQIKFSVHEEWLGNLMLFMSKQENLQINPGDM